MSDLVELLARWRRTYARLAVVTEAPAAAALDNRAQISHGKGREGSPPSRPPGDEPLADRHRRKLAEWYETVGEPLDVRLNGLRRLCSNLEKDVDRMTHRAPARQLEAEVDRDQRCLTAYEGMHYEDAAVKEGCSPAWMRKLRQRNARRPLDGLVNQVTPSQSARTLPATSSECASGGPIPDAAGSTTAIAPDAGAARH